MTTSTSNKQWLYLQVGIAVLLIVNIIISIMNMYKTEGIEIDKVWGKENYEKLKLIMASDQYKEQYAQNLDLMLQQLQGSTNENSPTINPDETNTTGTVQENIATTGSTNGSENTIDNNAPQWDE